MNYLYIGPISAGSTSKMRLEALNKLLPQCPFETIDTSIPEKDTGRLYRSIGWRFKFGPLINNISNYILARIGPKYDLVWIDKAVFIKPAVIKKIRQAAITLVHFTPDPAFIYHRSRNFFNTIRYYDFCFTSKENEIDAYRRAGAKRVILSSQGYDLKIHHSYYRFDQKKDVCFIGHYENNRAKIIESLINSGIKVKLAGLKWRSFFQKYKGNTNLVFLGDSLYGENYAKTISGSLMALGLLSKWIPETLTTRTIEIPACGTALVTEKTPQIQAIFEEDGAIYFQNTEELIEKIKFYTSHRENLKSISTKGLSRVKNCYDYESIVKSCLDQIKIQ